MYMCLAVLTLLSYLSPGGAESRSLVLTLPLTLTPTPTLILIVVHIDIRLSFASQDVLCLNLQKVPIPLLCSAIGIFTFEALGRVVPPDQSYLRACHYYHSSNLTFHHL